MIPELQGQFRGQQDNERNELIGSINAANEGSALIEMERSVNIQHVAGVIDQDEIERLRRLIFRSTKGKSYLYMKNYDDEDGILKTKRSVYIIVFWDGNHIRDKIQKICDSFSGNRYELPEIASIPGKIEEIKNSIENAKNVYDRTRTFLKEQLRNFDKISDSDDSEQQGKASTIYIYKMFLAKEKALYQTLNQMKWQNQSFIGYFWAPLEKENDIRQQLQGQTATKIMLHENHNIPEPTFFKNNEFSSPW
jgi:vacuolar-type H+-ATPase subunit I/STV1